MKIKSLKKYKLAPIIFTMLFLPIIGQCAKQYNFDRLREYNPEYQDKFYRENNISPPYAALFTTPSSTLLYIGAWHGIDKTSPTFQLVKSSIFFFKPELIIIEGVETSRGINPPKYNKHVMQKCTKKPWRCSEVEYAALLVNEYKIPYIGAAPSDKIIFQKLKAQGYPEKDVAYFYYTRQIPQYYREKKLTKPDELKTFFDRFLSKLLPNSNYEFADYEKWLQTKLKYKPSFSQLIDSSFPNQTHNDNDIQKIAANISILRDKNSLQLIFNSFESKKRIMIMLGASHYPNLEPVLKQYLGKPRYLNIGALNNDEN